MFPSAHCSVVYNSQDMKHGINENARQQRNGSRGCEMYTYMYICIWGVPDSSVGKESACNAGDPSLITGSGRSAGGGIGYPLWYSWALLVVQLVKNPPAMQETWVQSLGWEDLLKKKGFSSILAWRIPWTI